MKYDAIAAAYAKLNEELNSNEIWDTLMEERDRIAFLKERMPNINTSHDTFAAHRKSDDVIDFLANEMDPTKNKQYTQWIANRYHKGQFRQEDAHRVRKVISDFHENKAKLPQEQRDINKFPKLTDLRTAVAPHVGVANTRAERIMGQEELPGLELKYEDDNIKIHHLKDKETSKKVFGHTEWCTAAKSDSHNMFDHYNEQGPLHVVTRKSDGKLFQYHVNGDQFMDEKDEPISNQDLASIKPSLHKAWDQNPDLLK